MEHIFVIIINQHSSELEAWRQVVLRVGHFFGPCVVEESSLIVVILEILDFAHKIGRDNTIVFTDLFLAYAQEDNRAFLCDAYDDEDGENHGENRAET